MHTEFVDWICSYKKGPLGNGGKMSCEVFQQLKKKKKKKEKP